MISRMKAKVRMRKDVDNKDYKTMTTRLEQK